MQSLEAGALPPLLLAVASAALAMEAVLNVRRPAGVYRVLRANKGRV